jgi:hypothetical protein
MYEDDNTEHYDYFDYIDANSSTQQFEPDSDMDFISFKKIIRKEWNDAKPCWLRGLKTLLTCKP